MARTGLIKKPAAAAGASGSGNKAGGSGSGSRKARSQASSSSKPSQPQAKRAAPSRGKVAATGAAKGAAAKGKGRAGGNTRDEEKRLEVDRALEGAVRQTKKPEAKKASSSRNPPAPKRLTKAEQEEMVNRLGSTTLGGCPWWDK